MLVTRQGCHLCEQAEPRARSVCEELGASLELVDVDVDPVLRERFTHHVPVTFVHGRMLAYWALDEGLLRRALRGEPVEPPPPL
ncbi:glutaredoxin family protein [Luteococcus sediminum]